MATGLVICTHGSTGVEVVHSCEMIMGPQENVKTVSFVPGEGPEDLKRKYSESIEAMGVDEVLFLVDLFGGSPFNAAADLVLRNQGYEVVTGVNVPMVIEAFGSKDDMTSLELAKACVESGKEGIVLMEKKLADEEEEDEL